MRSMWSGSIGFGMVNIPVKLYKATEGTSTVGLCTIHSACGTAIKEPKFCPKCAQILESADIQKAYPEDKKKEHCIPIEEDELEALVLPSTHTIQIDGLIKNIPDIRWSDETYLLEPGETADRAYALLERVLVKTGQVGVAKITIGTKEHLCGILPTGDGLLYVATLHWASEIRDTQELHRPQVQVSAKELQMAEMLLGTLSQDMDLTTYHNEYGEALLRLVEAKKQGQALPLATPVAPKEVDLIDQLMASLKAKNVKVTKEVARA